MLDQVNAARDFDLDEATALPLAESAPDVGKLCSNEIVVWMLWEGPSAVLIRALQACCVRPRFRLIDVERATGERGVWKCSFSEIEAAPNLDLRTHELLRKLNELGKWVRAERVFRRRTPIEEDDDAYLWEAFARRPLP